MHNLPAGTVLLQIPCPECGKMRPVKIGKNGNANHVCKLARTLEDGRRVQCPHSRFYGPRQTATLIAKHVPSAPPALEDKPTTTKDTDKPKDTDDDFFNIF